VPRAERRKGKQLRTHAAKKITKNRGPLALTYDDLSEDELNCEQPTSEDEDDEYKEDSEGEDSILDEFTEFSTDEVDDDNQSDYDVRQPRRKRSKRSESFGRHLHLLLSVLC
jgi:hypothetical protein